MNPFFLGYLHFQHMYAVSPQQGEIRMPAPEIVYMSQEEMQEFLEGLRAAAGLQPRVLTYTLQVGDLGAFNFGWQTAEPQEEVVFKIV